jgi:uncharacterized protein
MSMAVTTEAPQRSDPSTVVGAHVEPERSSRRDLAVAVSGTAIVAFALESLVVLPFGAPSLGVRASRLLAIGIVAAIVGWAWGGVGRRLRGALEVIAGVGGLIGAGVATLARASELPSSHVAFGLAAAVGSVVLVASGCGRLVGSVPSRSRRVAAVLAGAFAIVYVATPVAFGVLATNRARPVLGPRTPADLGLTYEDVRITAASATLAGWYVPSVNGSAVLALAGSGSTRDDLLAHAGMLARHGYGVLMVDVPGHGGSTGEPMEFGWGANAYLTRALDLLVARPDVTGRVGALGLSMGGEEAITLAAVDARLEAVVSDGASGRMAEDAWHLPDPLAARVAMAPFHWLETTTADLLADAAPPPPLVDAVGSISPRALLLISGSSAIETEANQALLDAAGEHATWWSIADAPHIAGLSTHPAEYERRVIAFLDAALLERT